jgi:pimeloyl-ACP methyl ester carboxylesterase
MKSPILSRVLHSRRWSVPASLLFVAMAGFLVFRVFPLQIIDASDRFKLWRAGLHSIESVVGDHGVEWQAPECAHREAEARPACTCVVFVHGMGDSVLTWRKILTKRDWLSRLHEPVKLLAWDLPGHGKTPEPPKTADGDLQLRAQLMAQRLLGATQQQGCGPNTIWVGNSLGGWVSSWVALKRPDQVKGLVLVAPAGMKSQRVSSIGSEILAEPTVESLKAFRQRAYAKPQPDFPSWVWTAAVQRVKKSPVARVRAAQEPEDELDAPIHHLGVPTRVIWGKQDQILPLQASAGFREIPSSSLVKWQEVDDCGHLPQKECPEPLIDAIVEAIGKPSQASSNPAAK